MMAIDPRFFDQARTFVTETMKSVIADANVDAGSAINSILGRGAATINASLLQEIEHLLTSRDLTDPEALSEQDMDLLLENLLTSRDGGDLSFGFVRLYYRDRVRREFGAGLEATTEAGDVSFVTLTDLVYQPQDYFYDADLGLYYINVPFTAEEAGDEYNVEPGEISSLVNGNSAPVRVTNVEQFRNGRAQQTNTQAFRKAQRSISTRTPLSRDGAIFYMQELFGAKLQDLLVIGAGDAEMLRDEVYDLGDGATPRFQIGVDSLAPVTREQLGTAQGLHVGGRTDIYAIFDAINYVQKHVDLFADMTLDADISTPTSTITAKFVVGTTGEVPASGKLIIDLGNAAEETVAYISRTTVDENTYTFTLASPSTVVHAQGATVKVVNNSEIKIGENEDITLLPVFQIAEIRILDPITFEPIGDPLPETTQASRVPGWYVTKTNRYDLLSAKETKSIVLDEKRDAELWPGNQPQNGTAGSTTTITHAGASRTQYENAGADFTGYQGREVTLSGGTGTVTRTILQVLSSTKVVLSGDVLTVSTGDVDFVIDAAYAEYAEYPVRVSFYTNTELGEAQEFMDQDSKRILAGDVLVRAFMPVFLDFTLQYRGNGDETDIRNALNEVLRTSAGEAIGESEGAKFDYSDLINAAYENGFANYVLTPFQVRVRRLQPDGTFKVDYINPGPNTVNDLAIKTNPGVTVFADDGSYALGSDQFVTAGGHTFNSVNDTGKKIWVDGVGLLTILSVINANTVQVDKIFDATVTGLDWSFPVFFLETKLPDGRDPFTIPEEGKLILGGFTANKETVEYDAVVVSGTNYTFVLKEGQHIHLPHAVDEPLRVAVTDYVDANVIKDGIITDERSYRPFLGQVVIEKL